jgi:hypothetical protein
LAGLPVEGKRLLETGLGLAMSDQVFADGLGGILVTGSTVRLDFVAISPGGAEGQAKLELQQRVIMPVEGFLRAAAKIQEASQALIRPAAPSADKSPAPPAAAGGQDDKVPFP